MKSGGYLLVGVLLTITCAFGGAAIGSEEKDAAYYEKEFGKWTSDIARLRKTDTQGVGVEAIERVRTQIGKAQGLSAAEKYDAIIPIEQRIIADLRFAQAWIERVNMEGAADAAEQRAIKAEAAAADAKQKADAAKARADKLEGKGL